ncbi:tetratricopeptide repeat-containing sensor histidine kinase [Porifericola rhodea]|uniref:tetratricopeptide repeat-containing sensor histidine kinase n=1 Tax=Porifericola rhodea TaxID=930972 RepID=UPI002666A429|nr:tetratricopeptide repeat-containing sensor histidine kinase [Porifericola rhodea]WKN32662.1 tetratricopeptide repeat-containing sensor histidine kinase [Porifericola rhodea]
MPQCRVYSLIILFLLLPFTTHAKADLDSLLQRYDSLQRNANYLSYSESVELLLDLSEAYTFNYPDSTLLFSQQAYHLANAQGDALTEMEAIFSIARAYYIKGSYPNALDFYMQGIEYSEKLKDQEAYALGLNAIGIIYIGQHNYEAAVQELSKAIKINTSLDNSKLLTKNYFNIGLSYDESGNYDSAVYYLNKVIGLAKEIDDKRMLVMGYDRMGEIYYHMQDYKKALTYYQKVLDDTTYQSNWEYAFAYSGIAQTHYALGQYQQAVEYARESYAYAKKVNAKWDLERALGILAQGYAAINKFDEAYHYHQLYKAYSDSLYSEAKERDLNFLHLKHKQAENDQLARENAIQQEKNRLNEIVIILISLLAMCTIVVAVLIYFNYRGKNRLNQLLLEKNKNIASQKEKITRQNKELTQLNSTKDQLFSIIGHDLKSPFASIMGTFELIHEDLLSPQEQKTVLRKLYLKVSSVSEMLNNILYWANSQQKGIKAAFSRVELLSITKDILSVACFIAGEKNIKIEHASNSMSPIYADADYVRIILQNLVGNAIKFTPQGGNIRITYLEEEEYVGISIKDNGVGIPQEKLDKIFVLTGKDISSCGTDSEKGTGIGLVLVQQFVECNHAKLKVKSQPGKGTEFIVFFRKYLQKELEEKVEI